ncbi:MAG: ParA family protein [Gemmatimonadota bacterium]|nr:ParA family protein [Gemmatimonadota bacterium]
MTLVIAVANQKGGTGKTTVATSLAAAFAGQLGMRTLLLDMDGQCNATAAVLGAQHGSPRTIKDVLWHALPLGEVMVKSQHSDRLFVVAGSSELSYYEKSIAPEQWDDIVQEGRQILTAGLPEDIDLVVVDTPPSLGLWLNTALSASDAVVVVCEPGQFSLDGLKQLLHTISMLKAAVNPSLDLVGFVLNKYRTGVARHEAYLRAFRTQFGPLLLQPPIAQRIVIDDCQRAGIPIEFYPDRAAADVRQWFGEIARQVLARRSHVAPDDSFATREVTVTSPDSTAAGLTESDAMPHNVLS